MPAFNRRNFLKTSGLSLLPGILPTLPVMAGEINKKSSPADEPVVKFFSDGESFDGPAYWEQLQQAHNKHPIKVDRYGMGGAVADLEKKFEAITGKKKPCICPAAPWPTSLPLLY